MSSFGSAPTGNYHASIGGEVTYAGTMTDVVQYIANKRASGFNVKCGAEGLTATARDQQLRDLENHVEVYVLGFRLEEASGVRGLYLPGLFATEEEAQKYRAQSLGDTDGENYLIVPVNWRGASRNS